MKIETITIFLVIIFISLNSLGCVENEHQLSSDFTPVGKDKYSVVNDSNLLVFYVCEQQKVTLNLENKYTIRGNITNIGSNIIVSPEITATFFKENGIIPEFSNNDIKSDCFLYISPNQTVDFVIEKKYQTPISIENYEITVLY